MILYTFGKRSEYKLEIYLKIKFDLKMTEEKIFGKTILYCNTSCIHESKYPCGNRTRELNIGELNLYPLRLKHLGDMNCFTIRSNQHVTYCQKKWKSRRVEDL